MPRTHSSAPKAATKTRKGHGTARRKPRAPTTKGQAKEAPGNAEARPSAAIEPIEKPRYTPTAKEDAVLRKAIERSKTTRPSIKFVAEHTKPGHVSLNIDHQCEAMAEVLVFDALGTANDAFKDAIVSQLVNLATISGSVSSVQLNRLFAMVQNIGPRDETEAMLAVQMVAVHSATIDAARHLACAQMLPQQDSYSNSMNKLARTFAVQMETLKRNRSTGEQSIRVQHQHVTVNEGGQAVVAGGDVKARGGVAIENEGQPHGPLESSERSTPLLGNVKALEGAVQGACGEGVERVPVPRSTGRGAQG